MNLKTRLILWLLVIFLLPIAIFIYDKDWNWDAIYWVIGTTVLATGYETWHYFNTRNK